MLAYKTPGVYVEELPASGPIEGVGTSTAAFIGPALGGPIEVPVQVTNWTQFKTVFGEFMTAPRRFLAYAVRGFFENGGTVAWVLRVGNGVRAWKELDDRPATGAAGQAVRVEARTEGAAGNLIAVTVADAQIVKATANARVRRARAELSDATPSQASRIQLKNLPDAARFAPGDLVTIEGSTERVRIDHVEGAALVLEANLSATYNGPNVYARIANLVAGQKTFRVENQGGIEVGSALALAQQGGSSENVVVAALAGEFVTVEKGLANGYDLAQAAQAAGITSYEFRLTITPPAALGAPETFDTLSMDVRHSRYYGRVVSSAYVTVGPPTVPSVQTPPRNRPAVGNTTLEHGAGDDPSTIGYADYKRGLDALEKIDDVNLVCVPDASPSVRPEVLAHCERMGDRFAILDANLGDLPAPGAGSVIQTKAAVESSRGFAALYYPWLRIVDPSSRTGEDTLLVPPSGHVAGIYARSDAQRGVHKAPANELITGAVGLERVLTDVEQGELNVQGVDVLRVFPGKVRPIVWAARTTAPSEVTAWRYVNVRRLFLFVEESLQEGLRPFVFEPNDLGLWKKLHRTISEFLTRVWRSGALFGATPAEAFYVKVDEELNPPSVRALGQVIVEIGMAPVRPAEFVVVRIGLWDGGSQVNE